MSTLDKNIKKQALAEIAQAESAADLDEMETKYLGRKSQLAKAFKELKSMNEAERKKAGRRTNKLKQEIETAIQKKRQELASTPEGLDFDPTESLDDFYIGHSHILTQVREEIENFFVNLGFAVLGGPEVETDYYNFEALNIPEDHPARDMWDTYWLTSNRKSQTSKLLLRTHTSPMQVRVMEEHKPPLAVIVPGRTFRHEATDARHEHTFDQVEGFLVDRDVKASHLKYVLHELFRALFDERVEIELRPSYFPFTEPSFELFMSCPFCKKKGCRVCGNGWLEMLGSGMIHPKVFEYVGYKEDEYTGFAFGLGIARVAMLKYGIPDIRMFYQNDLRLLRQF